LVVCSIERASDHGHYCVVYPQGFLPESESGRVRGHVAGGADQLRERPFAVSYLNVSNPMKHNPETIKKLMWLSERRLPFIYSPSMVTRGISTPVTWAGFLVANNASGLAGMVLLTPSRS
jgi:trimethylamine:corrinoid methyltransferase-like protein